MSSRRRKPGNQDSIAKIPTDGISIANVLATLKSTGDVDERFAELIGRSAREGDPQKARYVLEQFVGAVDQHSAGTWSVSSGKPFEYAYARYLADAFEQILEAAKLRETKRLNDKQFCSRVVHALGLKRSTPGRRKGKTTHHPDALGAAYWFLVRRGYAIERANALLGQRTGATRRTVQTAADGVKGYGDPERCSEELLRSVFAPYAVVVADILRTDPATPSSAAQ